MPNDQALSIKEAAQEAVSTLNKEATDEPETEVVEETVDGGEESQEEAPEGNESPEPEEPNTPDQDDEPVEDESDFEHVDPKTLPKELLPTYKNLMKGFTQARQKDSERAKKAEEELAKLKEQQAEPEKPEEAPRFNTPEEYYAWLAKKTATEAIQQERVQSYRQQAVEDYPKLDPRLEEGSDTYEPTFDKFVGAGLDARLAEHIKENGSEVGFDYKSSFTEVKEEWDDYVDKAIKKYIATQNKLVKKNEEKLKKSVPKTSKAKAAATAPKSIREAMDAAREAMNNN